MSDSIDAAKQQEIWERSIYYSCTRFLQSALWRQGAASNDVVDTLAKELAKEVGHLAGWCNEQRAAPEIVNRAISYLAVHHDGPWRGKEWFKSSIEMLIEIAVPNSGVNEDAAEFLRDMQLGLSQSTNSAPTSKESLRITDEMAKDIKTLQDAACEYGLVSALLDMNESMFHGESLQPESQELLLIAATAAPFARQERLTRKID